MYELTVGQFLDSVNEMFKGASRVAVVGEVTEFKAGPQWVSFTLRDKNENALLKCVTGGWQWKKIAVPIADGMEVKVGGMARVTKSYGSFGFWFDSVEPIGEGALKKAYDELVKKLREEGLFSRKRVLPERVTRIGVVSSKSGVVIQDFRKNLKRFGYDLRFVDARVEGAQAVSSILSAIERLRREEIDVLVTIRGGGSLESMQAWNTEEVARALFSFPVPVVAGIGHDVDVPIAALVADEMVSTPTAAAHIVNATWDATLEVVRRHEREIPAAFEGMLYELRRRTMGAAENMVRSFRRVFAVVEKYQYLVRGWIARLTREREAERIGLVRSMDRIVRGYSVALERARAVVRNAESTLVYANPERNLRLGYSIVRGGDGRVVKSVETLSVGEEILVKMLDGEVTTEITGVIPVKTGI